MSQEGFPDGIHVVEVGQKQLQNSISGIDWPRRAKSKNVSRRPILWLYFGIPDSIFENTFSLKINLQLLGLTTFCSEKGIKSTF